MIPPESPMEQARGKAKNGSISGSLVTVAEPTGVASEAYRTLRTNIIYALVDAPPKVIVVTSPGNTEGKSTVCANLGVVLAQADKSTLIVDCDFRRPAMHDIFGLSCDPGLVDALLGEHPLESVRQEPVSGLPLSVLTAGTVPPSPADLLGSRRLSAFLSSLREEFEYILLDSAPVNMVSDSTILAAQGDGVLLTLDAQKTRKGDVRRAVSALVAVRANVLGAVMNNARGGRDNYYSDRL